MTNGFKKDELTRVKENYTYHQQGLKTEYEELVSYTEALLDKITSLESSVEKLQAHIEWLQEKHDDWEEECE